MRGKMENTCLMTRRRRSCEDDLIRVYNDIITTIGRGNGTMLVLLDLSAAFDTIDHDNLFSNPTKRVQIDNILSDFATIICGVPQGSVLGPLKFCLYYL